METELPPPAVEPATITEDRALGDAGPRPRLLLSVAAVAAIVVAGGAFVGGRASTRGRVDELTRQRAVVSEELRVAIDEADELETQLAGLEQERDDAVASGTELAGEIADLRAQASASATKIADLETSVGDLGGMLEDTRVCGSAVTQAQSLLDQIEEMWVLVDEWWMSEPGSDDEARIGAELRRRFEQIDEAEREFIQERTRCEQSVAAIPPCDADRSTLEVAVEAFKAEHGRFPDDEADLVSNGLTTGESDLHDVQFGEVVPTDGSPCPS